MKAFAVALIMIIVCLSTNAQQIWTEGTSWEIHTEYPDLPEGMRTEVHTYELGEPVSFNDTLYYTLTETYKGVTHVVSYLRAEGDDAYVYARHFQSEQLGIDTGEASEILLYDFSKPFEYGDTLQLGFYGGYIEQEYIDPLSPLRIVYLHDVLEPGDCLPLYRGIIYKIGSIFGPIACITGYKDPTETPNPKNVSHILFKTKAKPNGSMITPGIGKTSAEEFANAYQQFSFKLFDQVEKTHDTEDNVVISPLSAWFALGMLQQGAATTTLAEINQTLHLTTDFADLAQCNQQLTEQLMAPPAVWEKWYEDEWKSVLELANSFWADDEISYLDTYKDALHTYYQAENAQLDLQQQESLDLIDAWVNENTHGTIPSLKLAPNETMRMLLVNALYFKALWYGADFADYETLKRNFSPASGKAHQVPMMHTRSRMEYGETDGYKIVRLRLGLDKRFSMTFFLSGQETATFGPAFYDKAKEVLKYRDVKLSLPRFQTDYEVVFNKPLQEMGMHEAFTSDADFSSISTNGLFVSLVKQLTHIAIDEKGVEASSATAIEMATSDIGPEPEWTELIIDHPFFFCIEDHLCDKVLFLGHIQDIEKEKEPNKLDATAQPDHTTYYDMMGCRQSNLKKGLNIVDDRGRKQIICVK